MPSPAATTAQIKRRPLQVVSTSIDLTLTRANVGRVIKTTAKNIDETLPLGADSVAGDQYTMLVGLAATTGGGTLKVTSADTVNGGTSGKGLINSASTDAAGDSVTVVSDGANWWTIAQRGTWDAES